MNIKYNKKIPTVKFPSINEYEINENKEPLVIVKEYCKNIGVNNIISKPIYNIQGIPGAPYDIYLRKSAAELIAIAAQLLPYNYNLVLLDGWRPWVVQNRLYNFYFRNVQNDPKNKELSLDELHKLTGFFVSKPSDDIKKPFLHGTGGAIDLTIANGNKVLNMGTEFDDFSDKAWTNHFEEYSINSEVRNNRRMLYNIMTAVGFTNLPSEWWHYDFGNKFWAYFTGNTAMYYGINQMDIRSFPLQ